jgi:hypothetical protein
MLLVLKSRSSGRCIDVIDARTMFTLRRYANPHATSYSRVEKLVPARSAPRRLASSEIYILVVSTSIFLPVVVVGPHQK